MEDIEIQTDIESIKMLSSGMIALKEKYEAMHERGEMGDGQYIIESSKVDSLLSLFGRIKKDIKDRERKR